MSKKNEQHNGNTIAAQVAFDKQMAMMGQKIARFEEMCERYDDNDVFLRNMTVRFPDMMNSEYMIVIRCETPAGKMVAFQGGATLTEALTGLLNRMGNGSLEFKEDKYAR